MANGSVYVLCQRILPKRPLQGKHHLCQILPRDASPHEIRGKQSDTTERGRLTESGRPGLASANNSMLWKITPRGGGGEFPCERDQQSKTQTPRMDPEGTKTLKKTSALNAHTPTETHAHTHIHRDAHTHTHPQRRTYAHARGERKSMDNIQHWVNLGGGYVNAFCTMCLVFCRSEHF